MKRKTMITLALLSALGASTAAGPLITRFLRQQSADWSESVLDGPRRSQPAGDCAPFRYRGDADPRSQRYDCAGAAEARHSGPYPFSDAAARRAEEGIVVNLAELRLYYFPPGENQVQVYPLGIGQLGLETPEMTTRVGQKILTLRTPTAGIRARSLEKGVTLPAVVPAGPNNPWAAMRCVWPTVTVNISSTELTPQTALVCASARAVCG